MQIKQYEYKNARASEKRYKEETRKYGGFNDYFKEKYSNRNNYNIPKDNTYTVLIEENIIEDVNTPIKIAKKAYRRWLVKNHPDKGGNEERCAMVIESFNDFKLNA